MNTPSFPENSKVYFVAWYDRNSDSYWGQWGDQDYRLMHYRSPMIASAILLMLMVAILSATISSIVFHESEWSDALIMATPDLVKEQRRSRHTMSVPIPETSFKVRFISKERIQSERPGAIAFAVHGAERCVITFPAGVKIRYVPATQHVMFEDYKFNDTVAHEILHCVIGSWHE